MSYFFPKRTLTIYEFSFVTEAFWRLFTAWLKITFLKSGKYLPKTSLNPKKSLTQEMFETGKTIAFVINGLSVRTPWTSTCLIKVIATHKMLRKRKIPHTLHFGVKKNLTNQLDAHAWLSIEKETIVGGESLHYYKEISQILI
jgi:hypothetical protein